MISTYLTGATKVGNERSLAPKKEIPFNRAHPRSLAVAQVNLFERFGERTVCAGIGSAKGAPSRLWPSTLGFVIRLQSAFW